MTEFEKMLQDPNAAVPDQDPTDHVCDDKDLVNHALLDHEHRFRKEADEYCQCDINHQFDES